MDQQLHLPTPHPSAPPEPPEPPEPPASPESSVGPAQSLGLTIGPARTLGQVLAAWQLVYFGYRRSGLIDANPQCIHTAEQAVAPHAAVMSGRIGAVTVTTITAIIDRPPVSGGQGLPLDLAFRAELDRLRHEGRRLIQAGLFADRRQELTRCDHALFNLMRWVFFYGVHAGATDLVVGIHPRTAPFYREAFGLESHGPVRTYSPVSHQPIALMRLDLAELPRRRHLPPALAYGLSNPIKPDEMTGRFAFPPDLVEQSPLGDYLKAQRERGAVACTA